MIEAVQSIVVEAAILGGPVVMILMALSVMTLAVVLYKLWQFQASGVGRHKKLADAVQAWDNGETRAAHSALDASKSYLADVARLGMTTASNKDRLEAEAETRFAKLERGFRLLDIVAQLAPLLGLFGTVLGMIAAVQALQEAGDQVDPSILAGGIWVALLTTAAGLVVAMPTAAILSWLEARIDSERVLASKMITTILCPSGRGAPVQNSSREELPHAAPIPA